MDCCAVSNGNGGEMDAYQKTRAITTLIVFIAAVVVVLYVAFRGWCAAETFKSRTSATLFTFGLWILLFWALRGVWHYGLFGTAFDPRLWLLGVPLYLLYRRLRSSDAIQ